MKNNNFKKFQLNKLNYIKKTYKYMYIFRYHDIIMSENIQIKKQLQKNKAYSIILKQHLFKHSTINIKNQGSILIIYTNSENLLLFSTFKNLLKKLELISIINNNNIYSNNKLQLLLENKIPLNISIINSFLFFLYYLRKI